MRCPFAEPSAAGLQTSTRKASPTEWFGLTTGLVNILELVNAVQAEYSLVR